MRQIIINGATGLIGRALISYLDKSKYSITVLSRDVINAKKIFPNNKIIEYKSNLLPDTFENVFAVLNFAGASIGGKRWNKKWKQILYSSRINSTKNIAYAISRSKRKPEVFINSSAVGYYGWRDKTPADENSLPGKDFLSRLCVDWEECTKEIENAGVRTIRLRTGIVLSKSDGALQRMITPFKFFVGGKLGSGKQPFPYIHIEDLVRIIEFIFGNNSLAGAVNCVSPENISNKEFSDIVGKILHRPSLFTVPSFALKIILGEFADTILNGRIIIPAKLLDYDFKYKYPDLKSALNDLLKN